MIEPKFIYSCDHNLIEYGEKHKTVKVRRSEYAASDVFTIGGTFKSIDKIYSPDTSIASEKFSCKKTSFGCIYEEGIDFSVSKNTIGNLVEIVWGNNPPPANEYFYVDVTYDAKMDTEIEYDSCAFMHTSAIDTVPNVPYDMQIIIIKGRSKIYTEGRDFTFYSDYGVYAGTYSYNLYINWLTDAQKEKHTIIYYTAIDTYKNDKSKNATVNNEDENVLVQMARQEGDSVCPRCNGTGWYVGLFEKNAHRARETNRMIQEFVKLIYTTPSDDGKYFLTLAGKTVLRSKQDAHALISNIVANSLIRYEKMIAEAKSAGKTIYPSERIYQAGVADVAVYEDLTGVEASVTIVTANGQTTSLKIDS